MVDARKIKENLERVNAKVAEAAERGGGSRSRCDLLLYVNTLTRKSHKV